MRKANNKPINMRAEQIVNYIGGAGNEGASLPYLTCSKHGIARHLDILNEGGHNGTTACLLCVKELIGELNI